MAQIVRMVIINVFKEGQYSGEAPPEFNPADATRMPKHKVQRERLNLEEWRKIFNAAADMPPYIQNSMLLALVTGQRLVDIARLSSIKKAQLLSDFAEGILKRENYPDRPFGDQGKDDAGSYIFAIIASPNSEHFSSLAPSIRRSKS